MPLCSKKVQDKREACPQGTIDLWDPLPQDVMLTTSIRLFRRRLDNFVEVKGKNFDGSLSLRCPEEVSL